MWFKKTEIEKERELKDVYVGMIATAIAQGDIFKNVTNRDDVKLKLYLLAQYAHDFADALVQERMFRE